MCAASDGYTPTMPRAHARARTHTHANMHTCTHAHAHMQTYTHIHTGEVDIDSADSLVPFRKVGGVRVRVWMCAHVSLYIAEAGD